jgi:hypothetical protein
MNAAALAAIALALAAEAAPPPSATAEKELWRVALDLSAPKAGAPVRATVRVQARGGFHVNGEYPTSFVPDPAAAQALGTKKLFLTEKLAAAPCPADANHSCDVTLALPLTGQPLAGTPVSGTLSFSVCTADRCLIEKARLSVPSPGA